jgi:hypothetical protein
MSGTFSVGFDSSWVVIAPNGTRLDLTGLVDVKWTRRYKTVPHDPLTGPPQERSLPAGHELMLTAERTNAALEQLASQIEQGWWASGSADSGTSTNGSAFLYFNNPDGSQTTHQFSGASLSFPDGGNYVTEGAVKQTIRIFASREQVV